MKKSVLSTLVVSLLAAGLLAACGKPEAPQSAPGQAKAPVAQSALTAALTPVQEEVRAQRLSVSGNVMPWQEAVVGLEVGGHRITKVLVNVGDKVRKGQVLATLSTASLNAELLAASASLAEARANLEQASLTLERAQRLAPAGGVSEQELSQYKTATRTAQAKVEAMAAQESNIRLKLGFATLRAPDDGVISSRAAAEGAIAQAGAELFRLIRQGKVEWHAEVPADKLHLVKPGAQAAIKTPSGTTVKGTVRQVAPSVDLTSRNGLVYVDIPAEELKAGMYVAGDIFGDTRKTALLPLSAINTRDGRSHVFTVEEGRARARQVELGASDGTRVELLGGVPAGTRVVEKGAGFLKDGDQVTVLDAKEVR